MLINQNVVAKILEDEEAINAMLKMKQNSDSDSYAINYSFLKYLATFVTTKNAQTLA